MFTRRPLRKSSNDHLWHLLGIVELTYHPALAIAFLATVQVLISPLPAIVLDPISITFSGRGVPVTTFTAGVVVVDFVGDVLKEYSPLKTNATEASR